MANALNLQQMLVNGLEGKGSHVPHAHALEDLDWRLAGVVPQGVTHSIWQLLQHMIYWQKFSLALLQEKTPHTPEHADETWIEALGPISQAEWQTTVNVFLEDLQSAKIIASGDMNHYVQARPNRTHAEVISMLAGHNSYHVWQLLRQMLGIWPPPRGGDTW